MTYQVLARKWRPKKFKELVGQGHVVTVLVNALQQQRLHHAYLFTGTRGVGKTTIARIFAKSLNCETGITEEPCGTCQTCVDIDQGKFIDLLEIDAASRTKVDDTREILDNVQYAPTRGRYKVYLIDEVHMLSRSSFNALLKTLEEPPEHVKFILATTDPQKLPVTVLSRCLQFHLKALTVGEIEQKLTEILTAEQVEIEKGTLSLLSKAARGSMRDSLSLTDQAIAQGQGTLLVNNIQQMLGGINQNWPFKILVALVKQDAAGLMTLSQQIASYAPNYARLFAELIQLLHQIALTQVIKQHFDLSPEHEVILHKLCQAMSPEDVQLYYQIVLNGRKDLPYASDEQAAFDMTLVRLLAFKPMHVNVAPVNENYIESSVNFDDVNLPETDVALTSDVDMLAAKSPENPAPVSMPENDALDQQEQDRSQLQLQHSTVEVEQLAAEALAIEQSAVAEGFSMTSELSEEKQGRISADLLSDKIDSSNNESRAGLDNSNDHTSAISEIQQSESHDDINSSNQAIKEPFLTSQILSEGKVAEHAEGLNVVHQTSSPLAKEDISPSHSSNTQSPVEAALATRNMLRSRKKQMETSAKKPNDATERPTSKSNENNNVEDESNLNKNPNTSTSNNNLPDISTLPEQPFTPEIIDPAKIRSANQVDKWSHMIDAMELTARLRQLAIHATIEESSTDDVLRLKLDQSTKHLKSDAAHQLLEERISQYLNRKITVEVEVVEQTNADPYQIQSHINDKRLAYAITLIKEDPVVHALISNFQAELDEQSIKAR